MRAVLSLKSTREIEFMRASGEIVAEVLDAMGELIQPGVTTAELDVVAERIIRDHAGAEPAFKGYGGFPAAICASVNDEVVHGIPSKARVLSEGDIIGIDVGVRLDGFHADAARTFGVGQVPADAERLLSVTKSALETGIDAARAGGFVGDISAAVQRVAESAGYSVVRDLVGHGIGRSLHEEPQVPNFGSAGQGLELEAGLVIAIEPMVNTGLAQVRTLDDEWTIVTADGSLSAHFEHTVAITDEGPAILTQAA